MAQNNLVLAVKAGLNYLASADLLTSFSSPTTTTWQPLYNYQTSFVPALMLNSLSGVAGSEALQQPLARYLLKQRSPNWSFNYWALHSPQTQSFPYPDDLDDTFCALIGLYNHCPNLVDQAALAKVVGLLVATEKAVGGPYQTWLSSSPGWQDVDLAVNANIAYFISLVSNRLPNLDKYMETAINSGQYSSKYYPSPYPIYYYLARICPSASQLKLSRAIQQQLKNQPPSCIEACLALSALSQLPSDSQPTGKLLQQVLGSQQIDGSWPAAAFCLDPNRNSQTFYHGSAPLSTALALEAMAKHRLKLAKANTSAGKKEPRASASGLIHQNIVAAAQRRLNNLQPELKAEAQTLLANMLQADPKHQITLLPYWFARSLKKTPPLDNNFYQQLGLANLFGWMAYTTYDNFLDEEGVPLQLCAANLALRSSLLTFRQVLPDNTDFQTYISRVFDTIDVANTWELTHCRSTNKLPKYGQRRKLAERSLGHSLSLTAILAASGYKRQNLHVQAILKSFRHYLIARQLDDDTHDWQIDASKGHISYVVTKILKEIGPSDVPLKTRLPQMQRQFWYSSLPELCRVMQTEVELGRQAIINNPLLRPNSLLFNLLDRVGKSVEQTTTKQQQATVFLQSYRKTPAKLLKTS